MGFWGIEVKPGKDHPYHSDNVPGKLHVTQATLGDGSADKKSTLRCSVGDKHPINLCSLLPNKNESCSLNLEFDEDDLVVFSVAGSQSIHLAGYFVAESGDHLRDEYDSDSYGEDIAETETDGSSEFDTEDDYGDDFIDDEDGSDDLYPTSYVANSGVVIEEIVDDDDKLGKAKGQPKRLKKKDQSNESERQIVVKGATGVPVLESEDEDGFPISASQKSKGTSQEAQVVADKESAEQTSEDSEKKKPSRDHDTSKKRKVKGIGQDDQQERKTKKKKKQKEKGEGRQVNSDITDIETNDVSDGEKKQELKSRKLNQMDLDKNGDDAPSENLCEKKKKKLKKKKKAHENEGSKKTDQTASDVEDKKDPDIASEQVQTEAKSSQVRTFPNGLVIEEVAMGKPDGKRASPGKQVSVHYIGKLQKNGKIFDSNVGRAPFKFRLGVGQVIKGWDVGVNGMRVGDKRRLTIPPSMGYGAEGARGAIPPNAWLVFDVELKDVR